MRGAVIKARVGKAQAPQLISYLDTIPLDEDKESHSHGRRITSNPLMLSMVASVYEIRQGMTMPKTLTELCTFTRLELALASSADVILLMPCDPL